MARWVCGADNGVDPKIMGIGPAYAVVKALKQAGLSLADMDVMECNEAFAVQNLAVIKEIEKQTGEKVDMEKWNPMGGAIDFGHPNGASGARVARVPCSAHTRQAIPHWLSCSRIRAPVFFSSQVNSGCR